jgi:predicted nucleic acid-binding protein
LIVVDASVLVELLAYTPKAAALERRLLASVGEVHAPHLIDIEVAQVLRRFVMIGDLRPERGVAALDDLAEFPVHRHPHAHLLPRIWELRHNLTAYDAAYVALAEVLDAPLLTCDRRLGRASGHGARVEVV